MMTTAEGSNRRLGILLLAGTGVGFLPWFAISALGPFLVADLDASAALPGRLVGLLFLVGALTCLLMGELIARLGAARILLLSFAVCGVALGAIALAPTILALTVATAAAGLVLAVPMPAATSLVSERIPSARRGAVIGLAQSGQQLGALSAGAILPLVATVAGWRWSIATAALAVITLGAVLVRGSASDGVITRPAATHRAPSWLMVYALLMSSWTVSAVAYLPVFAAGAHGMSGAVAGRLVAVIGAVAIAGKILWGRVAGRAVRPTAPPILLSLIAATGLVLAASAGSLGAWAVWASAVITGASALAWPVVTLSLVARQVPAGSVGFVSGRILAAGFSGAAAGPMVFGWLLESRGFASAWGFGAIVTLVAMIVAAIAHRSQPAAGEAEARVITAGRSGSRHGD